MAFSGFQTGVLLRMAALLAILVDSVQIMKDAASDDLPRYYSENLRFHWALVEAVGNQSLTETYRGIVQKLHLSRLKNLSQTTGMQASVADHLQIVEAVRQGEPQRCEALMTRHVSLAHQRLLASTASDSTPITPETIP